MKHLVLAAALLAAAVPAAAVNVVTNGDFSAGNSGFDTGYDFKAAPDGIALSEGRYSIDTSALNTHSAWVDLADHTGDAAALYLIANGSGDGTNLWQQQVSVTPNTTYTFSAWVADVCCNDSAAGARGFPPAFTFEVLDGMSETITTLGNITPTTFGVWQNFTAVYSNTSASTLTLRITNLNTVFNGNDLGLDDISFTSAAIPEPATWGLMVAGFGLVGVGLRRRSRAVAA